MDRVFTSASTSVFEHSIGSFHLLNKFIKSHPSLSEFDKQSLLFSSLFSKTTRLPHHEVFLEFLSERYSALNQEAFLSSTIDHMVDDLSLDLPTNMVKECKSILVNSGETYKSLLVENKLTHLGMDDFDYLNRSMFKLSILHLNIDCSVIINNLNVIDGRLCFNSKDIYGLYEFFQLKYKFLKGYLNHRVRVGIDLMLKDALIQESTVRDFTQSCTDMQQFSVLDDFDFCYFEVRV